MATTVANGGRCGILSYAEGMTEAEDVMAEYRIAERYSEWRSAQALVDGRLDELNAAIRAAVATRAWGIRTAVCRVTGWSREHIRQLALKQDHAGATPNNVIRRSEE